MKSTKLTNKIKNGQTNPQEKMVEKQNKTTQQTRTPKETHFHKRKRRERKVK